MDELVASKKDKFKCQYFSTKEAVTDGYSNVASMFVVSGVWP